MTTQKKVVLWGASNHALVVADVIRSQREYEIAGFLDDIHPERRGECIDDAVVLGGREQLEKMKAGGVNYLIMAMGNNRARLELAELVRAKGYELAVAIHPQAAIAVGARIGAGTVVMAGAIINPRVIVGNNAIINNGAIVEHGCTIDDGALVNSRVLLAGNVTIGQAATIEIGAIVASNLKIGARSVIGAGSLVLEDIPDGVLAFGSPARVIKEIDARS